VSSDRGFNLISEPWIEVLTLDGTSDLVSLGTLFARAHELREITGDLPTQSFAILRICLAIVYRAVKGPETVDDWHELASSTTAPVDRIRAYLDRHCERFELFHERAPFFQVADLHTAKGEFSALTKLIADAPVGHPYFSVRIGHGLERLTAAEAARWLVHLQAYDISGIKSGAVGDARVKGGKGYPIGTGWAGAIGGIAVEGENLWRTILLNLIPHDRPALVTSSDRDRPAWEAPPSTASEAEDAPSRPYGPLDLFTWQSRRVRLIGGRDGVTAVLVANGDKITPQNRHRSEPMTAWRRSRPQQKALKQTLVYMPRQHDPSRALWRGLAQLLPCAGPRGKADDGEDYLTAGVLEWAAEAGGSRSQIKVRATGMIYGTQNAIVEDVFDDRLGLSTALLAQEGAHLPSTVVTVIESTEAGVRALRDLAANLVRAAGGDDQLVDGARTQASARAYTELDGPIRQWIGELSEETDTDEARFHWHDRARSILGRIGTELVEDAGPAAWIGREVRGRRITSPEAAAWFSRSLLNLLPRKPHQPEEDAA